MTEQETLLEVKTSSMFHSRKFNLSLLGVGLVVLVAIIAAVLKKYAGIDIDLVAKWAMGTIASIAISGSGFIAWEDGKKATAGQ